MKLEHSLEENALTLICFNKETAPALVVKLTPDLFSTRAYREIAECAFNYIKRHRIPPGVHLRDELEAKIRKGDEGKLIAQTIEAMERLAPDIHPAYVLEGLDDFIRMRRMKIALENASDALDSGDMDRAGMLMHGGIGHNGGPDAGLWSHEPENFVQFLEENEDDEFSIGIDALDDRGVTIVRKTMTLLIAAAKRGKSWWLITVGKKAILRGKNVLHITLENSEKLTAQRYCQTLFAMTKREAIEVRSAIFQKDKLGRMTSMEQHVRTPEGLRSISRAKLIKKLRPLSARGKLHIKEFPTGTLTVAQLEAYMDHLELTHGFKPDVLLLDYPDLMQVAAENMRIALGQLFKNLRGVAVKRNAALVVVTQGNRTSDNIKTVTTAHVAEDFSKIGSADTILTYSQTGDEKQMGLARILVARARDAEDGFMVLVSQNYPTGQFAIDSVYMSKFVQSEMERMQGVKDADNPEEKDDD